MSAEVAGAVPVYARRLELERALLSVQRERVALTESFLRVGVESRQAGIETLIIRLLRLQRALPMVQDIAFTHASASGMHAGDFRPKASSRTDF